MFIRTLKILGCIFSQKWKIAFSPKQLMCETLNALATAITSFSKSWIEVLCSVWKLYILMGIINIRLEFALNLYSAYTRCIWYSTVFTSFLHYTVQLFGSLTERGAIDLSLSLSLFLSLSHTHIHTHTHTHTYTHLCNRNAAAPL